jgi:glycerol-3-phosphate acyltransferase PlsY
MNFALLLIAAAVPAYLLGSVNGSIIASKLFYRKDIREYGSKNPGLTNFYRVFGKGGALLVIAIDIVKTLIPVLFGGWLFSHFYDPDMIMFGRLAAGFFVLTGTCYPVFYGFRGGRGVLVEGTILIIADWRLALVAWGMFIIITAVTRYVSLGSILGAMAFPIAMAVIGIGGWKELATAAVCAVLIIARHSPNIKRLIKGEESKLNIRTRGQ